MADGMPGRWDIMHLPKGPDHRSGLGTTNGWGIYQGVTEREHVDAVWEFAQFLTDPWYQENVVMQQMRRSNMPARKSLAPKYIKLLRQKDSRLEEINLEMYQEAIEWGYHEPDTRPLFKDDPAAAEILDPALERIFVTGDAPVSILKDICPEIEASQM
jgi:ABC-type glycerol-3-phosphate transport system substrate-binding protein